MEGMWLEQRVEGAVVLALVSKLVLALAQALVAGAAQRWRSICMPISCRHKPRTQLVMPKETEVRNTRPRPRARMELEVRVRTTRQCPLRP